MSEQQKLLRQALLMMGFEAPENYTLTQLKNKKAELEKSFEAPEADEETQDEPEADEETQDEPEADEETQDEPEADEVSFIAIHEFSFRNVSYKEKKKYTVNLELFNHFKLHDLVKRV